MQTVNKHSLKSVRSRLRHTMPLPEVLLWQRLRGRGIGYKFRRQYSISNFIVDFYSHELNLAIEIDGESHYGDGERSRDMERDNELINYGIRVLRFTNRDIMDNLDGVLKKISDSTPSRSPLTRGRMNAGFTLIEVVISIGLVVMLFGGIYLVYYSVLDASTNTEARAAISVLVNKELEIARNLPYDQVGTAGGVPSGVLTQTKNVTSTAGTFRVVATVRNVDDPFDGTLGGNPNDTNPADYKLVELEVTCITCAHLKPLSITARIAPKNLESTGTSGSLFVNVINASGEPVPDATVQVVNATTSPSINLTDTTNQSGVLQLVGTPTSTSNYQIIVTKAGYTSDRNYPPGGAGNPNPLKPYSTVAVATLTQTTFQIDAVSTVTVSTVTPQCGSIGSQPFTIAGTKLIGTNPDVLKFSTSSITSATGTKQFSNIEWDSYVFTYTGSDDLVGTIPLTPASVAPSSTVNFNFVLALPAPKALLVTVKDAGSGAPLSSSTVLLTKVGSAQTQVTGRSTVSDTDWSGGGYSAESGTSVSAPAGSITMLSSGGKYSTSTTAWLVSNTIDLGSSSSSLYAISWDPGVPAGQTTVRFQVAANTDNSTWNFVGPDGTAGTYYTAASSTIAGQFTNVRYVRYKAYLTTQNENATPQVDRVYIEFSGECTPPGQTLFSGLTSGTYTATIHAAGYADATSSITISPNWQQATVLMAP